VGEDRDDAFRRTGSLDVDRADACVRVRRAHERRIGLVRLRRVLDKTPAALNQRIVLDARFEVVLVCVSGLIHARPPLVSQS